MRTRAGYDVLLRSFASEIFMALFLFVKQSGKMLLSNNTLQSTFYIGFNTLDVP